VSATHIVPACASPRALSLSASILAQDVSEPFLTLETFRRLKAVRGRLGAEGTAVLSREGRVSEKLCQTFARVLGANSAIGQSRRIQERGRIATFCRAPKG
jgi:hypothetical protein